MAQQWDLSALLGTEVKNNFLYFFFLFYNAKHKNPLGILGYVIKIQLKQLKFHSGTLASLNLLIKSVIYFLALDSNPRLLSQKNTMRY